ncbi:S-layer homology domain-containing protein [Candidatus Babeliales bacterium]|nr:S-layer homology domain-containing protein [Candidatus Babeliales bacterium]
MQNFWQEHKHFLKGLIATLVITAAVGIFGEQTGEFMATVLDFEKPEPFDGTALPVREVPDWTNLAGNEYKLLAAQLPLEKFVELPNYDPVIFGTVVADLNWSVDQDLANQLVTYAVPYMGSYELNSREYEGSHLAVDIKIPTGTPVYAVANGKVVKIAEASSGFGKHVVIKHPDVPLLNENETVTLYSAYAHLSKISVTKNQIVKRGDMIGKSGNSGISTTPHLHFQIDREEAPWHPWWPFNSAEVSAAGLNFFDACSAGLGQAEAIKNTINPMLWVQRYLAADVVEIPPEMHAADITISDQQSATGDSDEQPKTEQTGEIVEPIDTKTVADTSGIIEPPAKEEDSEKQTETTQSKDSTKTATEDTVSLEDSTESDEESQEIGTNQKPVESIFTDVDSNHANFKAIKYLKEHEIISGYPNNSFQPNQTVSRVEALKMILLGLGIELQPMLDLGFPDTSNQQWYSDFIGTAVNRGIAKGYPDGTFGPGNTVNRAEYLKILLGSARIAPDSVDEPPYTDVPADAWFASFASYSKQKNIFPLAGNLFEGAKGVTRAEVAETLYRLIVLRETNAASYSNELEI